MAFEGAWYLEMNRGARHQRVLDSDAQRESFLELPGDLADRFGVKMHAHCLMGNHCHLLIQIGADTHVFSILRTCQFTVRNAACCSNDAWSL